MPQIGSDDTKNAVPLRNSIYKNNKGSKPRVDINSEKYRDNWDAIFRNKKNAS
jgi:hypothetical protein|tara:strand:- start:1708 stop:1866 length:159 start_codon:yes stop_codon:yes gene_type:complete